jgi:hypothetical protein
MLIKEDYLKDMWGKLWRAKHTPLSERDGFVEFSDSYEPAAKLVGLKVDPLPADALQVPLDKLQETAKVSRKGYLNTIIKKAIKVTDTYVILREKDYHELSKQFGIPVGTRPKIGVGGAMKAAYAIATSKVVPLEVYDERQAVCRECSYARKDDSGIFCGVCGCAVLREKKAIVNLAKYEENLPHWGCKHPERSKGKGWLR